MTSGTLKCLSMKVNETRRVCPPPPPLLMMLRLPYDQRRRRREEKENANPFAKGLKFGGGGSGGGSRPPKANTDDAVEEVDKKANEAPFVLCACLFVCHHFTLILNRYRW